MHSTVILQLLVLLALANGTPVLAKKLLGSPFRAPARWRNQLRRRSAVAGHIEDDTGRPAGILVTSAGAPLIGID
jgi:hypothetical protein